MMQSYTTLNLLEVLVLFLATYFGSYTEPSYVTPKAPTIVHTDHSEEYPEDGSVYEPKHVARNTTNTSNKLTVVYHHIILYHIY